MLTLHQLHDRTSADRKQRSAYVKIIGKKTGHTPQGLGFVAAKTYSRYKVGRDGRLVPNTNPNHYVSMIVFVNKKLQCHVSCSCADNLYRWEYANTQHDASEIEYSNGDAATTTNPGNMPALCKHLVCLYQSIRAKLPSGK